MIIIANSWENFKGDCNWFYGCNCNWYCNYNWFWDYNCNCNLGFYEETLFFQTLNFEILIQGIDALSWGKWVGAVRFLKIQLLPPQTWPTDFWTGASGFLVLLILLVLWFSSTLWKLGFYFLKDLAIENLWWGSQSDPWGRAHFSRWF